MHTLTAEKRTAILRRADELHQEHCKSSASRIDRVFSGLLLVQWIAGIATAWIVSPRTWIGEVSETHVHMLAAVFLGGLITLPIAAYAWFHPGSSFSRQLIAAAQAASSALFIHLMGGRIEAHFHIFGSLAFLAFYRDWRVLLTFSGLVAADHFLRGYVWPMSIFGTAHASPWRSVEHMAWVVFEDIFLIFSCVHAQAAMKETATQQAELENTNTLVEARVRKRTEELLDANLELGESIKQNRLADSQVLEMQGQLQQAQKLEAVGQLAAGIAHEINTPTQYVGDNTRFLKESFEDLALLLDRYEKLELEVRAGKISTNSLAELELVRTQVEPDFLREEVPQAIDQALDGIQRVSSIVQAMKEFSHPANETRSPVDLNRVIASTATVCRNEWRHHADIEFDFSSDLPLVPCFPRDINQVLLNLIVNASQAIAEAQDSGNSSMGKIRIRTEQSGGNARITIADDGPGVPKELRERIFEMFFTTKEVGKGTGQGLALAHSVIATKHGGLIRIVDSDMPGATFAIDLPLEAAACAA